MAWAAPAEIHQNYPTDQFGGFTDLPVPGGATGFFRIGQLGNRLTFVTPLGNAFLYKGIMVWNPGAARYEPNLIRKYGSTRNAGLTPAGYTPYAQIRMAKRYGINMIGWGSSNMYHYPVPFLGFGRTVDTQGYGFPVLPNHGIARTALTNGYTKDLIRTGANDPVTGRCNGGVKIAAWPSGGVRRGTSDLGDPNFGPTKGSPIAGTVVKNAIDRRVAEFNSIAGFDIRESPWLHSNSPDDADEFFGHKGGIAIHPGWICAITSPFQDFSGTSSAPGNVYDGQAGRSVREVFAKTIAREYLEQKYGTIANLNAAWGNGCNYTTFGSSNPNDPLLAWQSGTGTGFLDEDGVTHPWIRMPPNLGVFQFHYMCDLRVLPPNVKADLDAIMEIGVETFYRQYADVFRSEYPNHLLAGPSALKHSLGFWKPGVLRAAGRVFDYLQMDYTPPPLGGDTDLAPPGNELGPVPDADAPEDLVRSYDLARIPILAWKSAVSHQDSAAGRRQGTGTLNQFGQLVGTSWMMDGETARRRSTQEAKGGLFDENLRIMLNATGTDGRKFWLGFDNWNPIDQHGEGINWGFSTEGDNLYDGKQTQIFGIAPSVMRKQTGFPARRMQTDETGHPCTRWHTGPDNTLTERSRYGDSATLIQAATRWAEFEWLALAEAETPPVTGRTVRHGGSARIGGRITS